MSSEMNTLLLVALGVFILWLATSGKLKNLRPAWETLIQD